MLVPRRKPTSVTPCSAASSTASEDGADTAASTGTPAIAAFCTSSNDARPDTISTVPPSGTRPSSNAQPVALSTALCRPTSSRTTSGSPSVLATLPDTMRDEQRVFSSTGGLHAAALFTADGSLLVVREDIGRHNAVDKVMGWALLNDRVPLAGTVLMVSGRASFELVQKAAMAGVPALAAVSAPSSLAVDLAEEQGITLVGFLRGDSMNVYTKTQRINREKAGQHH